MKTLLSFIFLIVVASTVHAQDYKPVDSKSEINFTIKNFGINTAGSFKGLKGTIHFDPDKLSAVSFNVSVDVKTINTGVDMRDNHLQKEEYFNAGKYPTLTFVSKDVKPSANGYNITGDITIKGITKSVSFPFKASKENGGILFTGSFTINRKDFNVGGGSAVLSNNVDVDLKVFAQ